MPLVIVPIVTLPAVTFNAVFVVPPDAVSVSATLVDVEPVRVFEMRAPVVVTLLLIFPPVSAISLPIIEPDTAALEIAKLNIVPVVSEDDAR